MLLLNGTLRPAPTVKITHYKLPDGGHCDQLTKQLYITFCRQYQVSAGARCGPSAATYTSQIFFWRPRLIFSNSKYFSLQAATRTSDIRLASLTSPTWRRHFSDRNSSLLYPALYHFYTHLSELSFTCAIIFIVIKYLSFINFYKE